MDARSEYLSYQPIVLTAERREAAHHPDRLSTLITRIEAAVEAETEAIRTDPDFDLKASNERKSRHLYDLNKSTRGLKPGDLRADDRAGLLRLREKLAANERAVRAHLDAVAEVASLMRAAIARHEADGTYSSAAFGRTAQR